MDSLMGDETLADEIEYLGREYDYEKAHIEADKLIVEELRKIGYTATASEFENLTKYYA